MSETDVFKINYKVKLTKAARKQGNKLRISEKERLEIIEQLKLLKHWSENESDFEYENAFECIEFKFKTLNHWVRIIVFKDDVRKIMWIIKAFLKKTNAIERVHQIGIESTVTQIKAEMREYEKELKNKNKRATLNIVAGGKTDE